MTARVILLRNSLPAATIASVPGNPHSRAMRSPRRIFLLSLAALPLAGTVGTTTPQPSSPAGSAKEQAWLRKQPPAVRRMLAEKAAAWRHCAARFDAMTGTREAERASRSSSPAFYKITTGGAALSSFSPGLCPSVTIRPQDPLFRELAASNSNPQDGMVMWNGPREQCFNAAQRFAERYNRELARLKPDLAERACAAAR